MAIKIFFEFGGQLVQLPVNPAELVISSAGNNKTDEIIKIGEINILRTRKLATCKISSFLPQGPAPYVIVNNPMPPDSYFGFFEQIRAGKQPARFVISGANVNMLVSVEGVELQLKAGDDDYWYELSLKEYRPYSSRIVKIVTPETVAEPAKATTQTAERPKTGFAIGDTVTVNGKYWYSSYGAEPNKTFSNNYTGVISHIITDTGRLYQYHINTPSGGKRGWVSAGQMNHK